MMNKTVFYHILQADHQVTCSRLKQFYKIPKFLNPTDSKLRNQVKDFRLKIQNKKRILAL